MNYLYDKDELSAKVFDFIYGSAMRDAILQRAFNGKKDWVGGVENAKDHLRKYVDCIINNKFSSQEDHDQCFIKTANEICKSINKEKPPIAKDVFSFGNAQKLINIAVKYTYGICYYAPELRENFRYCHCPLDSIMLKKVWKLYLKTKGADKRKVKLKDADFFLKSWGDEGQDRDIQPEFFDCPERYKTYQSAIREIIGKGNLYPIEFDYLLWP